MIFADKITLGTYNFVSLIIKIILLALAFSLILFSLPATDKTQDFAHLRFYSNLQSMAFWAISRNYLKYFNGTTILTNSIPSNLALSLKDLKSLVLAIFASRAVALSLK